MKKVLVVGESNLGDEMDCVFLRIMTDEQWQEHLALAEEIFNDQGYAIAYVGTNQEIEYSSFVEYKNSFNIFTLTKTQIAFLNKIGLKHRFGQNLLVSV